MKLKGSVAVVTGAGSGIGRATALALADAGADVVLAGRRPEALTQVAQLCVERGVHVVTVPTDVSDCDAVARLAHRAVNRFGRIDVWVNAAAVTAFAPFDEISLPEFRRVLDVNVMGTVHAARVALPVMRRQGGGVLLNVSSVLGAVPVPYQHAYVMSKSAINALGASLRQELRRTGGRGIDVVTVMPPSVDTPIYRTAANHTGRAIRPLPPVYSPERIAAAIVRAARHPRREVVVGPGPRFLVQQARYAPAVVERLVGPLVSTVMLHGSADESAGNLFTPSTDKADRKATGGWHGRRRTGQRRLATAALAAGAVVVALGRAEDQSRGKWRSWRRSPTS